MGIGGVAMAKKKAPTKVGYLDFLGSPIVIVPTPTDWLKAPAVTVGKERVGDPIRRSRNPVSDLAVRDVPDQVPVKENPTTIPPKKKSRKRQPRTATARERAILNVPRTMKFPQFCLAVGLPLRSGWRPCPNGEKTIRDAYEWKNVRLLGLIKDERKNAWNLYKAGVI